MSPGKRPAIQLRTFLLLAIAVVCLAIYSFIPTVKPLTINTPLHLGQWNFFLYDIYGAKGVEFLHPTGVFADDSNGRVYVINTEKHKIDVFDESGGYLFSFGSFGVQQGQLSYPYGLAKTYKGTLLVTESGNDRIQEFSADGKSLGFLIRKDSQIGLQKPGPIRTDSEGRIYVGDLSAGKVIVLSKEGRQIKTIVSDSPHGIAIDEGRNRLYIASASAEEVKTYPLEEKSLIQYDKISLTNLGLIRGIDVDKEGNLYVVSGLNCSVMVFKNTGDPMTGFGGKGNDNGEMMFPNGIDVSESGRVYIADWGNNRINVWETKGL